tara:strand:- start:1032 stop:1463 length:432 start_codon:yes stop_codon:yes gene_type:complete
LTPEAPAFRLYKIGAKVQVDASNLKEKLPTDLTLEAKNNSIGTVIDYKMTDGTNIGVVVEFENKIVGWFFNDELNEISDDGTIIYHDKRYNNSNDIIQIADVINSMVNSNLDIKKFKPNSNIRYLTKPNSFINWLLYSIKDII